MAIKRRGSWALALLFAGVMGCSQSEPTASKTQTPGVAAESTPPKSVAKSEPARDPREPGSDPGEFDSLLKLATAAASDGRADLARQSFEQALEESRRLGDAAREAQAHGRFGLFLDDNGRVPEAQEQLQSAVSAARRSGDAALLVRCQLELGIFCQHQNQFAAAKELLSAACAGLDSQDPQVAVARNHLAALENRQACACGAHGRALVDSLRKQIISEAPPDLVSDVVIDFTPEAGFHIECDTSRKPTADEAAQLSRIVSQARTAFHERVRPSALR